MIEGLNFGKFTEDADADIREAADRNGVPYEFLKAIIAAESSGDWDLNNRVVHIDGRKPLYPYVGLFSDEDMGGDRKNQVDALAARLSEIKRGIAPFWHSVAQYHYSGSPDLSVAGGGYAGQVIDWALELR